MTGYDSLGCFRDSAEVTVRVGEEIVGTGLKKFGAVLGDQAEVGCNAVLNPGAILSKPALVMPSMAFTCVLAPNTIARVRQTLSTIVRRD